MSKKFKSLALTILTLLFLCLSGCTAKVDYFSYLSELRKDIFAGEKDNYLVIAYSGLKEDPAVADGVKNQTFLTLTFKVTLKEECEEPISLKFAVGDKNYECDLQFNPVKSTLCADVVVSALPEKNFSVEVVCGDQTSVVDLVSKLQENSVSYTKALECAINKAQSYLKENTKDGVFYGEIAVRLLCENDRNYYYVGIAFKNGKKQAYLINASTCEIIAEKVN